MTRLIASLTGIDIGALGDIVVSLEEAGVDGFHIDLGDGHFVPGLLYPPSMVAAVAERTSLPVEAHLMTFAPERYFRPLVEAGASRIFFHWEAAAYPMRVLTDPGVSGCASGIALNPLTAIPDIEYVRERVDAISLLTTEPDHSGERMLPGMTGRVRRAAAIAGGRMAVQVDGGVTEENARGLVAAGATELVIGRALTAGKHPAATVVALRDSIGAE